MLVRPTSDQAADELRTAIEGERRLKMKVVREVDYYKEQTRSAISDANSLACDASTSADCPLSRKAAA